MSFPDFHFNDVGSFRSVGFVFFREVLLRQIKAPLVFGGHVLANPRHHPSDFAVFTNGHRQGSAVTFCVPFGFTDGFS